LACWFAKYIGLASRDSRFFELFYQIGAPIKTTNHKPGNLFAPKINNRTKTQTQQTTQTTMTQTTSTQPPTDTPMMNGSDVNIDVGDDGDTNTIAFLDLNKN
jgi:hypothetical protein